MKINVIIIIMKIIINENIIYENMKYINDNIMQYVM